MERRLFIFRPGQTLFILSLLVALLFGCGGGGGGGGSGGTNPPPNNPPPGGGNPADPNTDPPSVVSTKPQQGETVSVEALIEITFTKPMDRSTFLTALQGLGIGYEAICVDGPDCKTVRFSRESNLVYDTLYELELLPQVRDQEGNLLPSSYKWSFKTQPFVSSFSSVTLTQMTEDAGECTAIDIDSSGTLHIVYYSESEGRPKHAFCPADCGEVGSWFFESIDAPTSIPGSPDIKIGRDINLAIAGDVLHVSYRDLPIQPGGSGSGILKYATGIKRSDDSGWDWMPVTVEDTDFGMSDTYIAVEGKTLHISYRKSGDHSDAVGYATATCAPDCADPVSVSAWSTVEVDTGGRAGAPNHIVVRGTTVRLTYYAGGVFKYAECASDCAASSGKWEKTVVDDDDGGTDDIGSENSLAIDANGGLHATYRNSTNGHLKYAFCAANCTAAQNWQKVVVDPDGAGSSQIKIDSSGALHVSYRDDRNKDLKYATCPPPCLDPARWSNMPVDGPGDVGWDTYVVVANGIVHISYRDSGNQSLKYAWRIADP